MKKNIFKKMLSVAIIGGLTLSLAGCGANTAKENGSNDKVAKIKESRKLVVGLSADYAPYEFHIMKDGKDQIVGLDIDIAKEVAKNLGVDLEIKEMEFGAIIQSVKNGMIDMGISGITPDEKRKEAVDFSDIYYEAEQGILINKDNKESIKGIGDLKGKKVGAQMGSIQAEIAKGIEGADVKLLDNVNTLILELKTGKLDAVIAELPVAKIASEVNSELAVADEVIKNSEGGSAIAIQKGNKDLVDEINSTIKELKENGKIDKFTNDAIELVPYQKKEE
ncbi:ABC transporter substrate-binding protein [Clostridium perfringens]|uniref:ABC transporter substrate-binding protein n=1 Tax=Clostridium perfringens TaxID=1502 RepID=UPI0008A6B689|nr:ABC transporter substrate-binding protein [Clostridium perfringens]AOY52993.1 putative amino acid ABC transporter [Clostridium perfringens]MDK0679640.1 ABC transporter substrate-binding protein [Clostridium perfringens]MDK0717976.1 ABC transporter substrate-binding protein [Clostridium perfringens]MDK0739752.1 ABC transporter substrate-binding protein [Clostridium perfringens]MDK0856108.1 ABC transporter substrate-binding protein [Clostridium perfringens]